MFGRVLISFLLLFSASAAGVERLSTTEIESLLSGHSVKGEFEGRQWVSAFATDGTTSYIENGAQPSAGRWRATGDQYCSLWPPSESWDCYFVDSDGINVVFVPVAGGKSWPGKLVAQAAEVEAAPVDGTRPLKDGGEVQSLTLGQYTFPVTVPAGFTLQMLTPQLESPRVLHFFHERLLIGSRSGAVYQLDPPYDKPEVLIALDDYPHSLVIHNGYLYIARTGSIDKIPYTLETRVVVPSELTRVVSLPGGRGHNSRTLKVGPDNQLYVSLGISGNCSDEYLDDSYAVDLRRGGVARIDESGTQASLVPYASGLRNPIGFDWHPESGALFATNNGPDHLGYEVPPEVFAELGEGSFHGMPWYQFDGKALIRDDCISGDPPLPRESVSAPAAVFAARSAPMDMVFLDDQVAGRFAGDAIVALHGSWATSNGRGDGDPTSRRHPKLLRVRFDDGKPSSVHDFITGFQLTNGARWARPMGLAVGPAGGIYFSSDDGIQGLYRLTPKLPASR